MGQCFFSYSPLPTLLVERTNIPGNPIAICYTNEALRELSALRKHNLESCHLEELFEPNDNQIPILPEFNMESGVNEPVAVALLTANNTRLPGKLYASWIGNWAGDTSYWMLQFYMEESSIPPSLTGNSGENSRQASIALIRSLDREILLRDINQLARTEADLKHLLEDAAMLIRQAFQMEGCIIQCGGNGTEFAPLCVHVTAYNTLHHADHSLLPFNPGHAPLETITISDAAIDLSIKEYTSFCNQEGIRAFIVTGAFIEGEMIGQIALYQTTPHQWSPHEQSMIEHAAREIALAIDRAASVRKLVDARNESEHRANVLARTLEKEQKLNRLQSEFVSMASHEFRTPLAILDASVQLLKRMKEPLDINMLHRQTDKMRRSILRLNGLVDSTLNLSRLEVGKLEYNPHPFNLRTMLEELIERHKEMGQDHIINKTLTALPDEFKGDAKLLEIAFGNLLSNATKYSETNAVVSIAGLQMDQHIEISVCDQGIGIPPEDIPRLFEKFFRASNVVSAAGTGIGLYLAREIILMHGGEINVSSILGQGTTFQVILPLSTSVSSHSPEQ